MPNLKQIQSLLDQNKTSLFHSYDIKDLAIFGSFARKEQTEFSDLDLLVDFNKSIGIRFIDLADELETLLGIKVDLVSRKAVKTAYLNAIHGDLIHV